MNSYQYKDAIKISLKSLGEASSMDELDKLYKEFRILYRSDFFQKQAKESEINKASKKAFSIYKKKRKMYDPSFDNKSSVAKLIDMPIFALSLLVAVTLGASFPWIGVILLIIILFVQLIRPN